MGLNKDDKVDLNYGNVGENRLFYDVIYNPAQTKFLSEATKFGHQVENGKMMFLYQAHQAFAIWHKILPEINNDTIKLLNND